MSQLTAQHHSSTIHAGHARVQDTGKIGPVIDMLVRALDNDPASPLRRALVLSDIARAPGTTMTAILEGLGVDRSALLRDLEWLEDHGCIHRTSNPDDNREIHLYAAGTGGIYMHAAMQLCGSYERLQNLIIGFINLIQLPKPSLRDAKILAVMGTFRDIQRTDIMQELYGGPLSTDNRAITNLVNAGLITIHAENSNLPDRNA